MEKRLFSNISYKLSAALKGKASSSLSSCNLMISQMDNYVDNKCTGFPRCLALGLYLGNTSFLFKNLAHNRSP